MKTALIFPGQGSQYIGMGQDFYSKYEVSRQIMDNLDNAIGRELTKEIFTGKETDISKTQNAQLCYYGDKYFNFLCFER